MSVAAWYHHKAEQCARMANDAIEPRSRFDFETERKLWLQIAEKIERDETAPIGARPTAEPPTMWTGILKGEKPAGTPIEFSTKLELVIKPAAKAFGVTIPNA